MLLDEGAIDNRERHVIQTDDKAAATAFRRAVELGCTSALLSLGVCYQNGHGVKESKERALACFTKLWRKRRDACAAANIASVHRELGDLKRAFAWWRKAVGSGSGDEMVNVGTATTTESAFGVILIEQAPLFAEHAAQPTSRSTTAKRPSTTSP